MLSWVLEWGRSYDFRINKIKMAKAITTRDKRAYYASFSWITNCLLLFQLTSYNINKYYLFLKYHNGFLVIMIVEYIKQCIAIPIASNARCYDLRYFSIFSLLNDRNCNGMHYSERM